MLILDICLSDLPSEAITTAKNGKKYIKLVCAERKTEGKFGETHYIALSQSKEEREAKKPATYLGGAKNVSYKIIETCDDICKMLIEKNAKYGNSALEPTRIFSKASTTEQLLVRIDDKLSRIKTTGMEAPDEDTLNDLIGYLILLKIATKKETNTEYKHRL